MTPRNSSHYTKSFANDPRSHRYIQLMGSVPAVLVEASRFDGGNRKELEAPTVSAVICAYNEEDNIGPLLAALIKERVNEIVVVASGCTDKTTEIVNGFWATHPNIKVIIEDVRRGKASAVNLALKTVTSKFVLFLPADVRPSEGSIGKLISGFKPEIGIRVGRPVPVNDESNVMGRLSHLIWTLHNRTLRELSSQGILEHASGEFFAIRRGIVPEIPDGVVNDDAYMAVAARRAGYRIDYENAAIAFMKGPATVSDYVSQRRRVLFGHIQVMKSTGRHPTIFETQAVARPSLVLQILRTELKGFRGGFRALMMGSTLEMISLTLSGLDRLLGRTHVIWRMVESTKSLPGSLPIPFSTLSSVEIASFSIPGVYPERSLGRSSRSDLALGQLSPRLEVAALLPYRCY